MKEWRREEKAGKELLSWEELLCHTEQCREPYRAWMKNQLLLWKFFDHQSFPYHIALVEKKMVGDEKVEPACIDSSFNRV